MSTSAAAPAVTTTAANATGAAPRHRSREPLYSDKVAIRSTLSLTRGWRLCDETKFRARALWTTAPECSSETRRVRSAPPSQTAHSVFEVHQSHQEAATLTMIAAAPRIGEKTRPQPGPAPPGCFYEQVRPRAGRQASHSGCNPGQWVAESDFRTPANEVVRGSLHREVAEPRSPRYVQRSLQQAAQASGCPSSTASNAPACTQSVLDAKDHRVRSVSENRGEVQEIQWDQAIAGDRQRWMQKTRRGRTCVGRPNELPHMRHEHRFS